MIKDTKLADIVNISLTEGVRTFISWAITTIMPAIIALISAITHEIPLFVIAPLLIFTLACGMTFLANYYEWRLKKTELSFINRVKDKLSYSQVNVSTNMKGKGIHLGIQLKSTAHFPIKFKTKKLIVKIEDRTPKDDPQYNQIINIPPNGYGYYNSDVINIALPKENEILEGQIEYEISYGRDDKLIYSLTGKKKVHISVREAELITSTVDIE